MKKVITQKENFVPGSKVPITYLIDYIKEGYGISDFIAAYPWIKRINVEKALQVLQLPQL